MTRERNLTPAQQVGLSLCQEGTQQVTDTTKHTHPCLPYSPCLSWPHRRKMEAHERERLIGLALSARLTERLTLLAFLDLHG